MTDAAGSRTSEWSPTARPPSTASSPLAATIPLLIYFTSGTVGYPKMVLHTQASCAIGHTLTAKYWHDLKPTDLHWTLSDTGWAKAAYGKLFGQWALGATVMQHDARGRFDAPMTLRMLERYGVTSFCAPPTAFRMMVLEGPEAIRPERPPPLHRAPASP